MLDYSVKKVGMIVEYDGTAYCGFQLQSEAPTVQSELERAALELTGVPTRVYGASRTDSGTHAVGQVVAISTESLLPTHNFINGMNAHLSRDVTVREAYQVDPGFEPRRHAISRVYRYTILNRKARSPIWERWAHHVPENLNIENMNSAFSLIRGVNDFAPFSGQVPIGKSTIREVYDTKVWREGELVLIEIESNSFLPGQVRRTVGSLLQVGKGKLPVESLRNILDGENDLRADLAVPAKGLCLVYIKYKDFPPK